MIAHRPLTLRLASCITLTLFAAACTRENKVATGPDTDDAGYTQPTAATKLAQERAAAELPLNDPQDFADAERGLIERDAGAVRPPHVHRARRSADTCLGPIP